ncbi:MAG: hypothetical protein WA110_02635, partial [Anaerolineaceae bacterium]
TLDHIAPLNRLRDLRMLGLQIVVWGFGKKQTDWLDCRCNNQMRLALSSKYLYLPKIQAKTDRKE